jgi:glycerate dehydrogenase
LAFVILTNADLGKEIKDELEEGGRCLVKKIAQATPDDYRDAEVLLLERPGLWLSPDKVARMPRLRLLQSISAGLDDIDFHSIPQSVAVCGNVGGYADAIAEYVFGVVLYIGKNLGKDNDKLRTGAFDRDVNGFYAKGKTIGVLGAGGIGRSVARVARGFGMRTIGMNTDGRPVENFDLVVGTERVDQVLRNADVLVIALPLTRRTYQMVDSVKLGLMKDDCILVNVGRGNVVDEKALYERLRSHPRFKAAVDVWWVYPKPGERFSQHYPFFELPNFFGSSHVAGDVRGSLEEAHKNAVENVRRFVEGGRPSGVANRSDYDWTAPSAQPTTK